MSLEKVVLLPHPPIALPEVAGPRFKDVLTTAEGMMAISKDIMALQPETIIIVTPHSSLHPQAFAIYADEEIKCSFAMFGAPQVQFILKNDIEFVETVSNIRNDEGKHDVVHIRSGTPLDHGSGVPIYYLLREGYQGKFVSINYTFAGIEKHIDFGKSIQGAAKQLDKKIVLVASGDLSHRITKDAPAGYHPDGEKFDKLIKDSIESGQYDNILQLNPNLRENAGECAYNSLMVAFGALNPDITSNKVYSYEAPFGVGYLVASL
jgi:aromatic ring-opening dioxygenase LigB subunit